MIRIVLISILLLYANTSFFSQWYSQNSGTTNTLKSVYFLNANIGWICGVNGLILKTTNGGINWINQTSNTNAELNSIYFIDANNGWACGNISTILRTTNGGTIWILHTLPSVSNYNSIQFVTTSIGWISGIDNSNFGNILKTTDGGLTWSLQKTFLNGYSASISAVNQNYIWVTDINQGVWKSTDSGINWNLQITQPSFHGYEAVQFIDTLVGWIGNSDLPGTTIFKTTNGGIDWTLNLYVNLIQFGSLHFVNHNYGYVATDGTFVSNQGRINRTTDGGLTWTNHITDLKSINSICFISNDVGWAVGDSGKIIHTINGGIPVELVSFTSNIVYDDIQLNWSTASEKNNYGFEIERRCLTQTLSKGEGLNEWILIGFVEGNGTTTKTCIYSFEDRNLPAQKYLYRLKQIDFDGTFKYYNLNEIIEINAPHKFELSQNYPNPLNPSTKISWQSPIGSWQTLKVYDVLGNEVATLVDEYKEAGRYEVEFSPETSTKHLASGVLFYQLRVGEFIQTKKMMIVR